MSPGAVGRRLGGHLGALLLGVAVALAATAVHRLSWTGLPVGLMLAVLCSLATAWHLRRSAAPRNAASYCLGWVFVMGLALHGRPEGDVALTGDGDSYVLMGTGLLVIWIGVASLAAPRQVPPSL